MVTIPVLRNVAGTVRLQAYLRAGRPKQWLKNCFVAAPLPFMVRSNSPGMAFVWLLMTCAAFSLAGSSVYLINDIADRSKDQLHPIKRFRPIASGAVSIRAAIVLAIGLMGLSLLVSLQINPSLVGLVIIYLVATHSYTFWLKHIPYLDITVVGALYGLRVLAGFVTVRISPPGVWIWVLLASLLALILELGKRQSEIQAMGVVSATRSVLTAYAYPVAPRIFFALSAVTAVIYPVAAWMVEPWFSLTTGLVVAGLCLYWRSVCKLENDTHPMEVMLRNKALCLVVACFCVAIFAAVFS